jgi:hypothetical protein
MLIERMKKSLDNDLFAPSVAAPNSPAEISHDWVDEDDESISVQSVEDQWCIVSDDFSQDGDPPKGNNWDDQDTAAQVSLNVTDRIKQLDIQELIPPSVKNPKNLLLLLHLLVGVIVVLHLAWDRYSWKNSAMQLEQELRIMSDKIAPPPVVPPPNMKPRDVPENDYGYSEWQREERDNVIMDNCWIHARASLSFQECAKDAGETAKEVGQEVLRTAKVFAKHTWKAAKKFKEHAEAAAVEAASRRRKQPY